MMKTSQHCCDKTMDGKMTLYHKYCFPNHTKSWLNRVIFVSF